MGGARVHRLSDFDANETTALCSACGVRVGVYRDKSGRHCRELRRQKKVEYRQTAAGQAARRAYQQSDRFRELRKSHKKADPRKGRRRRHGVSPADRDAMAAAQGHRCAICQLETERLVIDHDHATGRVRKLLCQTCNSALGFARESEEILLAAAEYVRAHRAL